MLHKLSVQFLKHFVHAYFLLIQLKKVEVQAQTVYQDVSYFFVLTFYLVFEMF